MGRPKRKLFYDVTCHGWWWSGKLGSWIRSEDLDNFNDVGYSSHRVLKTKKNAIRAFYSAPTPVAPYNGNPQVRMTQLFIKNGVRWERTWIRIEEE
jgi:hypothetical protein